MIVRKRKAGRTTAFTYDGLGRLSSKRLPDGAVITNSYNAEGGLTSLVMPGGLTWSATYNTANARTSEQLANAATVNRQFTNVIAATGPLAGLTLATIDLGRAVTNSFTYDAFRRVVTNAASGPLPEHSLVISCGYDRRGLITNYTRRLGTDMPADITRKYDGYGEVTFEQTRVAGMYNHSFVQTWDAAGRRTRLVQKKGADVIATVDYGYQVDGQMTSVTQGGQACAFGYEDSGLLWLRSNPWRSRQVLARFGNGKPSRLGTWAGTNYVFEEEVGIGSDSRLAGYSAARAGTGAWNDSRSYAYNARCQLTNEGVGLATGVVATNRYAFDPDRLGVLTGAQWSGGSSNRWQATALNPLGQVAAETWNEYGLKLRAQGLARNASGVSAALDGNAVAAVFGGNRWYADLSLTPGTHTLAASAQYPAGQYTATATSTFTLLGTNGVSNYYDAAGNVVTRVFPGAGVTNRTQTLTWDAAGLLASVSQRDTSGSGYDWRAFYDALGRRLRTVQTPVVSNVVNGAFVVAVDAWFDPEVEFEELGVSVNGERTFKVLGPDLDGQYGGLQGVGGLEATILETNGVVVPVLNDYFGNVLATVSGTNALWNGARVGGYGVASGYQAPQLGPSGPLSEALVWRSRRIDPTGFYWLGARYYDPVAGRFLSPDPAGHASSMDLYAFAECDPVNQFDPDGRYVAGVGNGIGAWGSQAYAGAGNLLDSLMRPFFSERYGLAHFNGGYEPDPSYERNFENGSTAFQLGHYTGYFAAEAGFQAGLTLGLQGLGRLATTATLRSMGMAGDIGAEATAWAARASRAGAGASAGLRADSALLRVEAGAARGAAGGMARAESRMAGAATAARSESYEAAARLVAQPGNGAGRGASGAAGAGRGSIKPGEYEVGELMPNGEIAGLGPGAMMKWEITGFDSKESRKLMEWMHETKEGFLYGFIQGGKVRLIRLPAELNFGHKGILKSGLVERTKDMRAFSIMKFKGGFFIFATSEVNPKGNYNLNEAHIQQLRKLLRVLDVRKNEF